MCQYYQYMDLKFVPRSFDLELGGYLCLGVRVL